MAGSPKPKRISGVNTSVVLASSKFGLNEGGQPGIFQQLIDMAKARRDVKGALYIGAVTVPLDVLNSNCIIVPKSNVTPEFMSSLTDDIIPVIYNHAFEDDGSGLYYEPNDKPPRVLGRVYSAMIGSVGHANRLFDAICTGQIITDAEAIDRIQSMTDFTQSITWGSPERCCSICGEDIYKSSCPHIPGRMYPVETNDDDGDEGPEAGGPAHRGGQPAAPAAPDPEAEQVLCYEIHKPTRAFENSFVLLPAYRECTVKAVEKNSASMKMPHAIFQYNAKTQIVKQEPSTLAPAGSHVTMNTHNETETELSPMELKDIATMVENVSKTIEGIKSDVAALKTNGVTAPEAPAPAAAPAAPAAPTTTPEAGITASQVKDLVSEGNTVVVNEIKSLAEKVVNGLGEVTKALGAIVPTPAETPAPAAVPAPAETPAAPASNAAAPEAPAATPAPEAPAAPAAAPAETASNSATPAAPAAPESEKPALESSKVFATLMGQK